MTSCIRYMCAPDLLPAIEAALSRDGYQVIVDPLSSTHDLSLIRAFRTTETAETLDTCQAAPSPFVWGGTIRAQKTAIPSVCRLLRGSDRLTTNADGAHCSASDTVEARCAPHVVSHTH